MSNDYQKLIDELFKREEEKNEYRQVKNAINTAKKKRHKRNILVNAHLSKPVVTKLQKLDIRVGHNGPFSFIDINKCKNIQGALRKLDKKITPDPREQKNSKEIKHTNQYDAAKNVIEKARTENRTGPIFVDLKLSKLVQENLTNTLNVTIQKNTKNGIGYIINV